MSDEGVNVGDSYRGEADEARAWLLTMLVPLLQWASRAGAKIMSSGYQKSHSAKVTAFPAQLTLRFVGGALGV